MCGLLLLIFLIELLRTGICCRKYVPDADSEELQDPGLVASLKDLPSLMNRPVTNYMRHQRNVEESCTCGVTNPPITSNPTARIHGGRETERNEFPFQVALVLKNTHVSICGGSLINSHFVLTAAHCVIDTQGGVAYYAIKKLIDLDILLGAHYLNKPKEVDESIISGKRKDPKQVAEDDARDQIVRSDVAEVFVHPGYTLSLATFQSRQIEDDIALIRLAQPVNLTGPGPSIWTSCLPKTDNYELFELKDVVGLIIGWGVSVFGESLSYAETLQKLDIPIISLDRCQNSARLVAISHNFICISSGRREMDAGIGDSGGPLLVRNTDVPKSSTKVQYIQVGLSSFQNKVESISSRAYSVYARVSEYLPWIYSLTDNEAGKGTVIKWCKSEL